MFKNLFRFASIALIAVMASGCAELEGMRQCDKPCCAKMQKEGKPCCKDKAAKMKEGGMCDEKAKRK